MTGPNDPGTAIVGLGPDNTLRDRIEDENITDAHNQAATTITVDSTTLVGVGTTAQAVFEELDNGIADHLADGTAAHAASAVAYTAGGTVAATDVQAAIAEVASDYATADVAHNVDFASDGSIHGFKGVKMGASTGLDETANGPAIDEVKLLTLSAGAAGDHFKLQYNGTKTDFITLPAGGFANLTAAEVKTGILTHAEFVGFDTSIEVVENPANTFEITFTNDWGWTDVGNFTVPAGDLTGDLVGTPPVIVDDGTGASTVGAAGTQYINVDNIAPGDIIGQGYIYMWGDPAGGGGWNIAPGMFERPGSDYECRAAGEVRVVANAANYSGGYTMLIPWLDMT